MGRSGTSAVTRVLSLCGAALPPNLVGPAESNLLGHWEPLHALALNDGFLKERGSSWFDPALLAEDNDEFSNQEMAFVDKIVSFLERQKASGLCVIKEPRIVLLNRYWQRAAQLAQLAAKYVIPIRSPAQVIASIVKNYGCTSELATMLWLKHNFAAERSTRGFPRIFVDYEMLLQNWQPEIERVKLQLHLPQLGFLAADQVGEFLSQQHWRQRESEFKIRNLWTEIADKTYHLLRAAALDEGLNMHALDEHSDRYRSSSAFWARAMSDYQSKYSDLDIEGNFDSITGEVS